MIFDNGYFPASALAQYQETVSDLGQPTSDVHVVESTSGNGTVCDAIVARVRAIAMP